jgi:beta-glucanase (GH16 family)
MRSLLALLLCCSFIGCNPPKKTAANKVIGATHYQLVWADEFNYTGLPDPAKWGYDIGGDGWGNNEAQFYTDKRLENARVENGHLIIEAKKEIKEGKSYTSARLVTKGKGDWQYGKLEVRAKIPRGRGSWPAIWMLGSKAAFNWPDDGEIDIMEHVGYDQGRIHASVHCKKYYHSIGTQKTAITTVEDCSTNFHVYSVTWNAAMVAIAVDGKPYFNFANEHTAMMHGHSTTGCTCCLISPSVAIGAGRKALIIPSFPYKWKWTMLGCTRKNNGSDPGLPYAS